MHKARIRWLQLSTLDDPVLVGLVSKVRSHRRVQWESLLLCIAICSYLLEDVQILDVERVKVCGNVFCHCNLFQCTFISSVPPFL